MLGVMVNTLTPQTPAAVNPPENSPTKPRDLSGVFSNINTALINSFCSPTRIQKLSRSQGNTDLLVPPARSSSVSNQGCASPNLVGTSSLSEQSPIDTDIPALERPRRSISRTHLYQKRRKYLRHTPQRKKHAPYTTAHKYRSYKASGTARATPEKVSQDLLFHVSKCDDLFFLDHLVLPLFWCFH